MIKLAIDVGSQTTKIYMLGSGIVLSEATCVAVETVQLNEGKQTVIKAYGDKARSILGKGSPLTTVLNLVQEGDVISVPLLSSLLSHFLQKIEINFRKAKNVEAMFVIPCGSKSQLKQKYLEVAENCNIGRVFFVQSPFAAVLGHNVTLSEAKPMFTLDVGYGVTNVCAVSLDGIISGFSINLGGGNVDVHLIDYIAENCSLKIGALTAEKLKNNVGSLFEDDNKLAVIDGMEIQKGVPASVAVNSSQIMDVVKLYVDKILEYVSLTISKLPAEVVATVVHDGIYLSGGFTRMDGFAEYVQSKLSMPVNVCEDPRYASVIGAGIILSNDDLTNALATID